MAKAVSEKSKVVLDYLNSLPEDANVTAADIAEALGETKKSIDGRVTSGLIRGKGYAERVEAQIEVTDEEGNVKYKDVKFIRSTPAGRAYDHEAALAEDAAEKAAKSAE
jgi:hypothetical protein